MRNKLVLEKEESNKMPDIVIGPITRIVDTSTFQMQVTHLGNHNKYSYNNYEIVFIAPNPNLVNPIPLSHALIGRRVKCSVRYRDNFNRLICDVETED